MRRLLIFLICVMVLTVPVSAMEFEPPPVPDSAQQWMPENTGSFAEGFWELITRVTGQVRPDLRQASRVSLGVVAVTLAIAAMGILSGSVRTAARVAGTTAVSAMLLLSSNALIALGVETVRQISDYGKLLLPVMTAAMAAQGGVTVSTALYGGTALFDAVLTGIVSGAMVPGIYVFLSLSAGSAATGEGLLENLARMLKQLMSWTLKSLLMVFTTYLGITGVVSGTTDAAALKAAKVTISSFVPVVGGVLSEASEAVLVSAGVLKNAAGIYGILAVLAVFLHPFLKIGTHYLILKLTAGICAVFGEKHMVSLIDAFSSAMGLLLGMTGACCVLVLISTVCFLRGVM